MTFEFMCETEKGRFRVRTSRDQRASRVRRVVMLAKAVKVCRVWRLR